MSHQGHRKEEIENMSTDYESVEASYNRCLEAGGFFNAFYDDFLLKSPDIPPMFKNTDFKKQKQMVRMSVRMMIRLGEGHPETVEAFKKLGERHSSRQLDIPREFYGLWLDSLCECVKQFDPEYSEELEQKWRDTVKPGIDMMVSMY